MAFEYELPDVGEGVAEGELVTWHVEPGDSVTEDDVLADIETDKAVVDLPAPVTGTIQALHADPGDIVPVGDVVVTIAVEDETSGGESVTAHEEPVRQTGANATGGEEPIATPGGPDGGRVFAPPNVRRLAREMGVDITAVKGSGPGGRITEQDVRAAAGSGGVDDETVESAIEEVDDGPTRERAERSAGEQSDTDPTRAGQTGDDTPEQTTAADRDRTLATPATRRIARENEIDIDEVPTTATRDGEAFVDPEDVRRVATAEPVTASADTDTGSRAVEERDGVGDGAVTREPYRGVRRTIGEKMAAAADTIPHATHHDTAVVDELVETREALRSRAATQDVDLTYLPFVMKAVVAGLREYPVLNSRLDEDRDEIVYNHDYHIGMAVATDAGLLVPVVENVGEKSLVAVAEDVADLTERARNRSITRDEMQGGTFSITNFGSVGGEYATPIINHPETAILGLGSIEQRPVAEAGEVGARHTLPLSLSIDHRVIDGAEAAQFVNTVIEYLEQPRLLLLE